MTGDAVPNPTGFPSGSHFAPGWLVVAGLLALLARYLWTAAARPWNGAARVWYVAGAVSCGLGFIASVWVFVTDLLHGVTVYAVLVGVVVIVVVAMARDDML